MYVNHINDRKIITNDTILRIIEINNIPCSLSALLDTGSPVSFISPEIFYRFFGSLKLVKNNLTYNSLNGIPIYVDGSISTSIKLKLLPNLMANIDFLILKNSSFSSHLILRRDFLTNHEISVTINPSDKNLCDRVRPFSEIASTDIIDNSSDKIDNLLNDIEIDFDAFVKQLITVINEIDDSNIPLIESNYAVKVNLKDDSIFAYSPRRYAYIDRKQIREITDDLLSREIIKESNSPYCARVVPARKKNDSMRLCIFAPAQ